MSTTGPPYIFPLKNVGKLSPRHLIGAVVLVINGQLGPPDRYRPRVTGGKAHREVPKVLVGTGCAVTARDEDRHMLHPRQLLQAAIEGVDVVGRDLCYDYAQADAHHAARIGVAGIIINDALQFIVHLRPGIIVRIAIRLVYLDRGSWGKSCSHLYVQRRFTLRIRRVAIDVDEGEMSLEVNTAQVVLNIILVGAINLHEVDSHILTMHASLPELVVTIGPSNIS